MIYFMMGKIGRRDSRLIIFIYNYHLLLIQMRDLSDFATPNPQPIFIDAN